MIWDCKGGKAPRVLPAKPRYATLALSSDGSRALVGSETDTVIYNLKAAKRERALEGLAEWDCFGTRSVNAARSSLADLSALGWRDRQQKEK